LVEVVEMIERIEIVIPEEMLRLWRACISKNRPAKADLSA
jgi:hypothetical protein